MSRDDEFREYRTAVMALNAAMRFIAQHNLPKLRSVLDQVDALGPVMKPHDYRVHRDKIEFDKSLIDAAMPLWEFCKKQANAQSPIIQSPNQGLLVPK